MDWIELGYWGLFLGSFISATLIPLPSEGLLVLFLELDYPYFWVISIATFGNFLGGLTNYYLGRLANIEFLERKFNLNQEKLSRWRSRFDKYGVWLGLLSWLPFVGDPMLVALGVFKVKIVPLSLLMFLGKLIRYIVVAILFYYL
ncbi:MAG: YqaA family protein [Putridiphycobacter sp.]